MSSAILYLAIVGIWALVLVPRWLHTKPSLHRPYASIQNDQPSHAQAPETDEGIQRQETPAPAARSATAPQEPEGGPKVPSAPRVQATAPPPVQGMSPAPQRKGTLEARRHTLGALVLLTLGAVALAITHLVAPWIIAPPALMLAVFLVLLREAAHIDAERMRRPALDHQGLPSSGADAPDLATGSPGEAPPGADVIDISGRVDGQFYDQYTDTVDRAVGD